MRRMKASVLEKTQGVNSSCINDIFLSGCVNVSITRALLLNLKLLKCLKKYILCQNKIQRLKNCFDERLLIHRGIIAPALVKPPPSTLKQNG